MFACLFVWFRFVAFFFFPGILVWFCFGFFCPAGNEHFGTRVEADGKFKDFKGWEEKAAFSGLMQLSKNEFTENKE